MRANRLSQPAEYILVPVPASGRTDECRPASPPGERCTVEHLVARYTAAGWTLVAHRAGAAAPQLLFRRPLSRRPAA